MILKKFFSLASIITIFSLCFSISLSSFAAVGMVGSSPSVSGANTGTTGVGSGGATTLPGVNYSGSNSGTTGSGSTYNDGFGSTFQADSSSLGNTTNSLLYNGSQTSNSALNQISSGNLNASAGSGAIEAAQASALSSQGSAAQGGTGGTPATPASSAAGGIAQSAGTCSIGTLASQMITSTVGKALGAVSGAVKNLVVGVATGKLDSIVNVAVPIVITGNGESQLVNQSKNTTALVQKSVTTSAAGAGFDGIISTFTDIFNFPSLDAIGFCIANEMIRYIANSTIVWINSGFKGSPVFISNTGQFFKGIEQQELGNFVNGVAMGTLGINLCQPFKVVVLTNTLGGYAGGRGNPLSCTLDKIKANYNQFTKGNWNSGGFPGWFELIQQPNNAIGATLAAKDQAYINITTKQNTAIIDLNWSKGYRDFDKCQDKSSVNPKTGKCANGQPATKTTLGGYIENQVNARGAAGMNRLNIATSFDQVVSALVNELIKIAINKVFDTSGSTSGGYSGGSSSSNASHTPLTISCSASSNTSYNTGATLATVNWSTNTSGGSGNFSYSWGGAVIGNDQSVVTTYTTPGTKIATITVYDASSKSTSSATCSTIVNPIVSVSCDGIASGNSITWSGSATGGSGDFSYSWAEDASGSGQTVTNTYSTSGTKTGTLTVFDSISGIPNATTCSATI
ncbi:MAG: hypothetical protein WCF92_01640 [bacterium]